MRKSGEKWGKKPLPKNFVDEFKIEERQTYGYWCTQINATQTIDALKPLKTRETYCVLAVTSRDLFEGKSSVCGLARPEESTGVFSFCRYDPWWPGNEEFAAQFLMRACYIMAHEITHMFGLTHCIYYECLMNGSNGPQ